MKRHIIKFILMAILMIAVFMAFAQHEKTDLNGSTRNVAKQTTNR